MVDEEKIDKVGEKEVAEQPKKRRGRPPKSVSGAAPVKKAAKTRKSKAAVSGTKEEKEEKAAMDGGSDVMDEDEFEIKINIKGKPSAPAVEDITAQRETVMNAISSSDNQLAPKTTTVKEDIIAKSEDIAKKIEVAEEIIAEAPVAIEKIIPKDDLLAGKGGRVRDIIEQEMKKDDAIAKKEIDSFPEAEPFKPHHSRSLKLYRKIVYFFAVLLVILFVAIFYFSYVKVKIILIPNQESVSNSLIFDVYDQNDSVPVSDNSVTGVVRELEISQEKKYEATGKELIGQEVTGKVDIVNNYNKNQPLVASTRLMSSDGKIFRLKNTVNVPAGGSVADVDVYADEPKQEMAIGPSKFTIPGLWAGLQDKIYAESKSAFNYGEKNNKHIAQEDIDNGMRDIRQVLLDKAKEEVNKSYGDYSNIIYNIVDNSTESKVSAKANEEKPDFTISMKARVLVVAFNNASAAIIAKQKLSTSLPENKELVSFDDKNIVYALNNYNSTSKTATVNASFEGKVGIKDGVQVIDKEKLIGLSKEQIDAYLDSVDELASHEVIFYPSFIKRIPSIIESGKIEVEVKK